MNSTARLYLLCETLMPESKISEGEQPIDFFTKTVDSVIEILVLFYNQPILKDNISRMLPKNRRSITLYFRKFILAEFIFEENFDIDKHKDKFSIKLRLELLYKYISMPVFVMDKDRDIYICSKNNSHKVLYLKEVINIIINKLIEINQIYENSDVKDKLVKYIQEKGNSYALKNGSKVKNFISNLTPKDLKFNEVIEYSLSEEVEDKLHDSLLLNPHGKVGRYMTLESFFKTINDQKLYFGNIIAMNDKSELDYYEKNIYKDKSFYINCSEEESQRINRAFITSYVKESKIDNLTIWRLYGDDAKGVCLIFSINECYDNSSYFLKEISYCPDNNAHEEIQMLSLFTEFSKNYKNSDILKASFRFNKSYIWKYFFKAKEYSDEDEVRLLYYNEDDKIEPEWRLNNNIVVPSVKINLKSKKFPLKLEEVRIGPKAFEKNINQKQIKQFLNSKGFGDVTVTLSKINNYR